MDRALSGGQLQKVSLGRVGTREVVLFQVRIPGETAHVLIAGGLGVGIIDAATRERLREALEPMTSIQSHWRAHLERARISWLGERTAVFAHDGASWRASAQANGALILARDALESAPLESQAPSLDQDALHERGSRIAQTLLVGKAGDRRDVLRRALKKATARLERRVAAVTGDLAKMTIAEEQATRAQLFVGPAARSPRGATVLQAIDWSTGTPQTVQWSLDPAKGAQEQIEATFRRAKRMKDAAHLARARQEEAQRVLTRLQELLGRLATSEVDLTELEALARAQAPRDFKLASNRAPSPGVAKRDLARPPYRRFTGVSGLAILVGRGAAHNDELTLHVARPHDLWLHAKGRTGAHVVVPLRKDTSCPPDLLVEAAHLAAHFSEARGESLVDVQYVPRRYLRKPRASAPGAVLVDREKVIVVRMSDDILQALLMSETDVEHQG